MQNRIFWFVLFNFSLFAVTLQPAGAGGMPVPANLPRAYRPSELRYLQLDLPVYDTISKKYAYTQVSALDLLGRKAYNCAQEARASGLWRFGTKPQRGDLVIASESTSQRYIYCIALGDFQDCYACWTLSSLNTLIIAVRPLPSLGTRSPRCTHELPAGESTQALLDATLAPHNKHQRAFLEKEAGIHNNLAFIDQCLRIRTSRHETGFFDVDNNDMIMQAFNTAVSLPYYSRSQELVEKIIQAGGCLNPSNGPSPLAFTYSPALMKILLSRGARLELPNRYQQSVEPNAPHLGDTPLLTALSRSEYISAMNLIDHGANVNATNQRGETPLIGIFRATVTNVKLNQHTITLLIKLLFTKGARDSLDFQVHQPEAANSLDGHTALSYALTKEEFFFAVPLILEHNPNLDRGPAGKTPREIFATTTHPTLRSIGNKIQKDFQEAQSNPHDPDNAWYLYQRAPSLSMLMSYVRSLNLR